MVEIILRSVPVKKFLENIDRCSDSYYISEVVYENCEEKFQFEQRRIGQFMK